MLNIEEKDIISIGKILNDKSKPLTERFRALFTLKNIGGSLALQEIQKGFADPSALLKHELAYCLGQMQDSKAIPILVDVLKDKNQEPMVRHEAGEALGAIGSTSVIPILQEYCNDSNVEVAETCEIALNRIMWLNDMKKNKGDLSENPYKSVDPAPPAEIKDIKMLTDILLDDNCTLFDRYRAMFSLRNLGTTESILAIAKGLNIGSALFRHEIAFVLGQLREEVSVPHLQASLEDEHENEMVRHECAEALGAIATPYCFDVLKKYLKDEKRVVRESCYIALDMLDYENNSDFQYANSLTKIDT